MDWQQRSHQYQLQRKYVKVDARYAAFYYEIALDLSVLLNFTASNSLFASRTFTADRHFSACFRTPTEVPVGTEHRTVAYLMNIAPALRNY